MNVLTNEKLEVKNASNSEKQPEIEILEETCRSTADDTYRPPIIIIRGACCPENHH